MAETYTSCPNCNSEIKTGVFNSNAIAIIPEVKTDFIHEFTQSNAPVFCGRCYSSEIEKAWANFNRQLNDASKEYGKLLKHIPIITLQVPYKWDYTVMGMLTSQSVTGTGVVSEISSSFSDFFGLQSGNLNKKLKTGEGICATQLRAEALSIGANAIIGVDIDYAEVGGDKGMLMVCMTGTSVKLKNTDVLESDYAENMVKLNETVSLIKKLNKQEAMIGK